MNILPELFVGLSYFSLGAWMGFLLYDLRFVIWPPIAVMGGAVVCGITLHIIKIVKKRIIFVHFYLIAIGSALLLASGVVLLEDNYHDASLLGAPGFGIVYVAGLSYLHVRIDCDYRKQRAAMCVFWLFVGTVSSFHASMYFIFSTAYTTTFGYFIIAGAGLSIALVILNEMLHCCGLYDYKRCLNYDLNVENEKANLFADLFVAPQNHPYIESNQSPALKKHFLYSTLMAKTKVVNGFMYNLMFLLYTTTVEILSFQANVFFIKHYLVLAGLIIGLFAMRNVVIWTWSTILSGLVVIVAASLLYTSAYEAVVGLMWAFYLLTGFTSFFADMAVMEFTSLKMYELKLSIGVLLHQTPYLITSIFADAGYVSSFHLWLNVGLYILAIVVIVTLVALFHPNTSKKTVLEVHQMLLFPNPTEKLPISVLMRK